MSKNLFVLRSQYKQLQGGRNSTEPSSARGLKRLHFSEHFLRSHHNERVYAPASPNFYF